MFDLCFVFFVVDVGGEGERLAVSLGCGGWRFRSAPALGWERNRIPADSVTMIYDVRVVSRRAVGRLCKSARDVSCCGSVSATYETRGLLCKRILA